jgi:putative redox protein
MTLRMYAERKGWPLQEAIVRLRHSRTHGADCANCESPDARMDRVECEIELVGPLDDSQRERLMHIAKQCPVHRTLKTGFHIEMRAFQAPQSPRVPADL